jgi:Ca2+-binding RTX toxin-like protein
MFTIYPDHWEGLAMSNHPTNGPDNLKGTNANNKIDGLAGNDTIQGLGGNDSLKGGSGNDSIYGGNKSSSTSSTTDGNDTLEGGLGNDKLFGNQGNDTFIQNSAPVRSAFPDLFSRQFRRSRSLHSGSRKNRRAKAVIVEEKPDAIVELPGEGIDTVLSGLTRYQLDANVENLTLVEGTRATSGFGNELNNVIRGNLADNILGGGIGDDLLEGGLGDDTLRGDGGRDTLIGTKTGNFSAVTLREVDTLTGGAESDRFVLGDSIRAFYSRNGKSDRAVITDFTPGIDKIQLKGAFGDYVFRVGSAGIGTNKPDTQILLRSSGDLIAIAQDIAVVSPSFFVFV